MNVFSLVLAIGPIAVYFIVLGLLHWRKSPKVISGGRDLACLGLAMIGMFLVGPAELFFPQAAFNLFGISVWLMMVLLYLFMLMFAILNSKPRLIVFGLNVESLTGKLDHVLQQLDPATKWLDHTFVAPQLGIRGAVEPAGWGVVSHIVAAQREQDVMGWITLERELSSILKTMEVERRPSGHLWISFGILLLGLIGYTLFSQSPAIAQGIREMLRN